MSESPILGSRLTVLAGCYGSGKTNLALNLSLTRVQDGRDVTAVDLDMINPYFRMTDGAELLKAAGVDCLFSDYANTNVDLPHHFPQLRTLFGEAMPEGRTIVVDVGGDETGAVALGSYAALLKKNKADVWLVLNKYRPFAESPAEACESIAAIEQVSRMEFTGIVPNPNLGVETDIAAIRDTADYYGEVSEKLDLPILFTCVREDLTAALAAALTPKEKKIFGELYPLKLFTKPGWEIQ